MASNRTFLNERTDLTATEVSPRGQGVVADKPSEKHNTRVITVSKEKKSIKMLNIKGLV